MTDNQNRELTQAIKNNWVALSTLAISLVALYVSFQSNRYAREANNLAAENQKAKIQIIGGHQDFTNISIAVVGCLNKTNSTYNLENSIREDVTIVNNGGRNSSLIDISFIEGDRNYYDIKIKQPTNENQEAEVQLPIDVESGTGRIWQVEAYFSYSAIGELEALSALNNYTPLYDYNPEIDRPAIWQFSFSDGTIIEREYGVGWYHIMPSLFREPVNECTN